MAGMIKLGVDQVNRIYPLAGMYTAGIVGGNIAAIAGFPAISLGVFLLFSALVQWKYVSISSALHSHAAKKNYRMQAQKKSSLLKALYIKEIKRYFASNIYVLNTLIGYILMVAIAVMLAFTGIDKLEGYLTMSGGESLTLPFPFRTDRRRQSGLAVSGSRSLCLFFRGIRDHGQSEDAGIQLG